MGKLSCKCSGYITHASKNLNSFRFTMGHKKLWYFFVECNSLEQISALKTILMGTNIVKKESFPFKTFTEKINCYSNMNKLQMA